MKLQTNDQQQKKKPVLDRRSLSQQLRSIYKVIIEHAEASTGECYADSFWALPDRKQWPMYYTTIAQPISIQMIDVKGLVLYYVSLSSIFRTE